MGIMNLILAVVVDSAMEARQQSEQDRQRQQQRERRQRTLELVEMVAEFDIDGNGTLSADEIREAFSDTDTLAGWIDSVDILPKDIDRILEALQAQSVDGEISYE